VSTICLPDVTAHDQISHSFPLRICITVSDQILEVGMAWEWGYPASEDPVTWLLKVTWLTRDRYFDPTCAVHVTCMEGHVSGTWRPCKGHVTCMCMKTMTCMWPVHDLWPSSSFIILVCSESTKFYPQAVQRCSKMWGQYLDCVMKVSMWESCVLRVRIMCHVCDLQLILWRVLPLNMYD